MNSYTLAEICVEVSRQCSREFKRFVYTLTYGGNGDSSACARTHNKAGCNSWVQV
jgi:hypothetical protein